MLQAVGVISLAATLVTAWRAPFVPPPLPGDETRPTGPIVVSPGKDGARTVEVHFIAERVLVHTTTDRSGVPANGIIAVLDTGLLLVDTGWTEPQTEAILRWGEERLKRPWVGAVITHDHNDRHGGMSALTARKIPVAALDLTVARLERRERTGVTTLFKAQDRSFADPRGFEAFYPGPGHAADNIVVRVGPVLFAGCLLKATDAPDLGNIAGADLAAWPASVRAVAERYPDRKAVSIIVPGHGQIDASGEGSSFARTLHLLATYKPDPETETPVAALLGTGAPAPDFTVKAHNGDTITLSKLRGQQVVLYFYPKDDTPGCTKEACEFRDRWGDLKKAGVQVFGVSTQDNTSHTAFAQKYTLPFPLIPDEKGELAAKYFVPVNNGKAQRITYLIGKDGRIQHVWPQVDPVGHAQDILKHLADR